MRRMKKYRALFFLLFIIILAVSGCKSTSEERETVVGYRVEYVEDNENGETFYKVEDEIYQYRITVFGRSNNAKYESYYVVLTNEEDLTFDTVDKQFWGSDMSKWGAYHIVEQGSIVNAEDAYAVQSSK